MNQVYEHIATITLMVERGYDQDVVETITQEDGHEVIGYLKNCANPTEQDIDDAIHAMLEAKKYATVDVDMEGVDYIEISLADLGIK